MSTVRQPPAIIIETPKGQCILKLGSWARRFANSPGGGEAAVNYLKAYLKGIDPSRWPGHDPYAAGCNPTPDELRDGTYRVQTVDTLDELERQEPRLIGMRLILRLQRSYFGARDHDEWLRSLLATHHDQPSDSAPPDTQRT